MNNVGVESVLLSLKGDSNEDDLLQILESRKKAKFLAETYSLLQVLNFQGGGSQS